MRTQTALHLSTLACCLDRLTQGNLPQEAAKTIHELHRLGKALRARYVATCNYPWANTPAYEKRTENMQAKLLKVAAAAGFVPRDNARTFTGPLSIELQTDPRGWPVILNIGGRVVSVGGEVV